MPLIGDELDQTSRTTIAQVGASISLRMRAAPIVYLGEQNRAKRTEVVCSQLTETICCVLIQMSVHESVSCSAAFIGFRHIDVRVPMCSQPLESVSK